MIKLVVLGVSGSIGKQVLRVVKEHKDLFEIVGVSVNTSTSILNDLVNDFPSIKLVGVSDEEKYKEIKDNSLFNVTNNLLDLIHLEGVDMVVNAIVGIAGLKPTIETVKLGIDLALANKESIVCGGDFLQNLLKKSKTTIYPIDSEHSAIAQCLKGEDKEKVSKLVITASGGPFRDKSLEDLECVTKIEALNHPNWSMGNKITIDSATLVNKGLEVIEAHYLFDMPYNKIETLIHYESIIHSMVEYVDGSIKAQLGNPSMDIPIQYALFRLNRSKLESQKFDFNRAFDLHFKPVDLDRFEAIKLAYEVGNKGGSAPLIYNAANEQAVNMFLNDLIKFKDIVFAIKLAVKEFENEYVDSLEDILELDIKVRNFVKNKFKKG